MAINFVNTHAHNIRKKMNIHTHTSSQLKHSHIARIARMRFVVCFLAQSHSYSSRAETEEKKKYDSIAGETKLGGKTKEPTTQLMHSCDEMDERDGQRDNEKLIDETHNQGTMPMCVRDYLARLSASSLNKVPHTHSQYH